MWLVLTVAVLLSSSVAGSLCLAFLSLYFSFSLCLLSLRALSSSAACGLLRL